MEVIFSLDSDGDKKKLAIINVAPNMFTVLNEVNAYLEDATYRQIGISPVEMKTVLFNICANEGINMENLNSIEDMEYEEE